MNVDHLVRMANDIANFFIGENGEAEAAQGIALHMQKFWDPRMRAAIIQHVRNGGAQLLPAVIAAVRTLPPPPR